MDQGIQKETVREDADEKNMGPCDRDKREVCTEERESVSIVEKRKGGSKGVCPRAVKEGVYPTIQITTNGTGIFCREKGWEEADGTRLLIFE